MKTITIAICTHNRADLLQRFLPVNIAALRSHPNVEILVVDNGSSDDTPAIVETMRVKAKAEGVLFRVVREEVLGLSAARNRAISEFDSDLLAFLDDDAYIAESWPAAISEAFNTDPNLIAAGGPVLPVFEVERPSWLVDGFLWAYSLDTRKSGEFSVKRHPLGVNMIFTRDTIKAIRFSEKLGRVGSDLLSAEETVIFDNIFSLQAGRIGFVNFAVVNHFVDERRMTKDWLMKRYEAEGRSKAIAAKVLRKPRIKISFQLTTKITIGWILEWFLTEPKRFLMTMRLHGWRRQLVGLWLSNQQ